MAIYAARKLIEAAFTTAAINAKIDLLDTLYGLSGATATTNLAAVADGNSTTPRDAGAFPAVIYFVGYEGATGEIRRFGKRDVQVPVVLLYVTQAASLATAKKDIEVSIEALLPIIEALPGTTYGSSARTCGDVSEPDLTFVSYDVEGAPARTGGELRFQMTMRTEGV